MRRDLPPPPDQPDDHTSGGVSRADGEQTLAVLAEVAASYHQLMRRALTAVLDAHASCDVTALTGLSAGAVLELDHRLPVPVVRQLQAVCDRLAVMPDVAAVYAHRVIEFDDLAGIVGAARQLSGAALAELDSWAACRAADLAAEGLLHVLVDDVAARAEQRRAPGWASRQERRAQAGQELRFQSDFDGGGLLVASLDRVGYPAVRSTIEAVAGPPSPTGHAPTSGPRRWSRCATTQRRAPVRPPPTPAPAPMCCPWMPTTPLPRHTTTSAGPTTPALPMAAQAGLGRAGPHPDPGTAADRPHRRPLAGHRRAVRDDPGHLRPP